MAKRLRPAVVHSIDLITLYAEHAAASKVRTALYGVVNGHYHNWLCDRHLVTRRYPDPSRPWNGSKFLSGLEAAEAIVKDALNPFAEAITIIEVVPSNSTRLCDHCVHEAKKAMRASKRTEDVDAPWKSKPLHKR
jgi:hypothetical protein